MTLELHPEEVQAIIFALGELPSRSNVWPLQQKIAEMYNEQEPKIEVG